jgi:hypothetical protein
MEYRKILGSLVKVNDADGTTQGLVEEMVDDIEMGNHSYESAIDDLAQNRVGTRTRAKNLIDEELKKRKSPGYRPSK